VAIIVPQHWSSISVLPGYPGYSTRRDQRQYQPSRCVLPFLPLGGSRWQRNRTDWTDCARLQPAKFLEKAWWRSPPYLLEVDDVEVTLQELQGTKELLCWISSHLFAAEGRAIFVHPKGTNGRAFRVAREKHDYRSGRCFFLSRWRHDPDAAFGHAPPDHPLPLLRGFRFCPSFPLEKPFLALAILSREECSCGSVWRN